MGGLIALIPSPHRGRGWLALASRVRGRVQSLRDHRPDAIKILQDVLVPEANDAEALAFEVSSSSSISLGRVLSSINFDDQALRRTKEVDDIAVDFDLLSKLESVVLTRAQDAPEFSFRIGGVPAQLSRPACQEMLPCHDAPFPRRCRADPLPRRGEGFSRTVNA